MTISSLTQLAAGAVQQSLGKTNSRLAASIAHIASGNRIARASEDVAALSAATSLQTETTSLRAASLNIAQASSLLQVADGGLNEIGSVLDRMQALAVQANSGALDAAGRQGLNAEFQALSGEIDRLSANTNFNGIPLLDGSQAAAEVPPAEGEDLSFQIGASGSDTVSLGIGDVSTSALFGGKNLNLLSLEGANEAFAAIGQAIDVVTSERAGVGSFQQALDYAGNALDVAIQNQEAARATLQDTDLAEESTLTALLKAQRDAGIATLAQTNHLSDNLLKLIG